MKAYQQTLNHKEHLEMKTLKPITQKTLDEWIEQLNADAAEYSHERTSDERKDELRPTVRDRNESINYLQMWVNYGCKTTSTGMYLIQPSKNNSGEISVDINMELFA